MEKIIKMFIKWFLKHNCLSKHYFYGYKPDKNDNTNSNTKMNIGEISTGLKPTFAVRVSCSATLLRAVFFPTIKCEKTWRKSSYKPVLDKYESNLGYFRENMGKLENFQLLFSQR